MSSSFFLLSGEEALKMQRNGKYTDFQIKCGSRSWSVHKVIICSRSEYFDKPCSSDLKEKNQGFISLDEPYPRIVHDLVTFLYANYYNSDDHFCKLYDDNALITHHAYLYACAEKYLLSELKAYAKTRFVSAVREAQRGMSTARDFLRAIYIVYQDIPEHDTGLRNAVVELVEEFPGWIGTEKINKALCELSLFASDLAKALISQKKENMKLKVEKPRCRFMLNLKSKA